MTTSQAFYMLQRYMIDEAAPRRDIGGKDFPWLVGLCSTPAINIEILAAGEDFVISIASDRAPRDRVIMKPQAAWAFVEIMGPYHTVGAAVEVLINGLVRNSKIEHPRSYFYTLGITREQLEDHKWTPPNKTQA